MKTFPSRSHAPTHVRGQEEQNQGTQAEDKGKQSMGELREEKEEEGEEGDGEDRVRCEWDFNLSTVVSSSSCSTGTVTDALGVIEFDHTCSILATGGIARKIRIYSLKSLLPRESSQGQQGFSSLDHASACDYYICTPAKLSSIRWKPGSDGRVLGSGDYDGLVMEYDLERRTAVFERDEHGGRRVWALDYAHWDPVVGASGSDDGTVQLWDTRCESEECVARLQPSVAGSAVCCVEFNPFGAPIVAVGCADRKAYGYDVRMMAGPVIVLEGHKKTVTYVKFLDASTVVSAGVDGCLKLWNLEGSGVIRTYKGHVNNRNFVGLSVWREGGLLGCGSESNQVFVYDKRWGEPIWVHGSISDPVAAGDGHSRGFVSSVCWRQVEEAEDRCTLVTGASDGVLQVFEGSRKK